MAGRERRGAGDFGLRHQAEIPRPRRVGIAHRRSPRTGSTCCVRWCSNIRVRPARCAIDSSSTTACRSWRISRSTIPPSSRAPISCASAWSRARAGAIQLPYSARSLESFEAEYCDDRFWGRAGDLFSGDTRLICTGQLLAVVGRAGRLLLHRPRDGHVRPVPAPVLPAVPDRALPPRGAAVDVGRARGGDEPARSRDLESVRQFKRAIRAVDGDLPALHAPLLVPPGVEPVHRAQHLRSPAPPARNGDALPGSGLPKWRT